MVVLIDSPRLSKRDRAHWALMESLDARYTLAQAARLSRLSSEAQARLRAFFADGTGYIGVSWGKDSVVVAHLAVEASLTVPLVSVRAEPLVMPECDLVRDSFLAKYPTTRYEEIVIWCRPDPGNEDGWHQSGTLEAGFAEAQRRFGERYASGVRAAESGARKLRMRAHGYATTRTLAPIGWWRAADVYAHLHQHSLPVHPAYAMTLGGALDRGRRRVAFLTLRAGERFGSREHERHYYSDHLRALYRLACAATLPPP